MDAVLHSPASVPCASAAHPFVVKLGGSVVRGSALQSWLEVIVNAKQPTVIVPGGGALADEVRQCQHQLGFGDVTAHRMALLAMDQLAWAIAGLRPGMQVGVTEADLRNVLRRGHVAIWAPSALVADRSDVEASWRLTSDSLALWLAGRLGANGCYLLKSVSLARGGRSAGALTREGIVDEAFPELLADTSIPCAIFGRGDEQALAASLAQGAIPAVHLIEPARMR